jgi:hypothetical protein
MSFCIKCGTENAQEWTGFYSSETGEKVYRDICPKACAHGDHAWQDVRRPFWRELVYGRLYRCERCQTEVRSVLD